VAVKRSFSTEIEWQKSTNKISHHWPAPYETQTYCQSENI